MKDIKELLILVRDNISTKYLNTYSICLTVGKLEYFGKITKDEHEMLFDYLNHNLPKRKYGCFKYFSWPLKHKKPRIDWLNEHINLNK